MPMTRSRWMSYKAKVYITPTQNIMTDKLMLDRITTLLPQDYVQAHEDVKKIHNMMVYMLVCNRNQNYQSKCNRSRSSSNDDRRQCSYHFPQTSRLVHQVEHHPWGYYWGEEQTDHDHSPNQLQLTTHLFMFANAESKDPRHDPTGAFTKATPSNMG